MAQARHAEMKEEERVKRLAEMQRRQEARTAMQSSGGGGAARGGGAAGFSLPKVSVAATNLLHAAAQVMSAQIVAVLDGGDEQLFALSVAEVVWSQPGRVRREALSDIEKVAEYKYCRYRR